MKTAETAPGGSPAPPPGGRPGGPPDRPGDLSLDPWLEQHVAAILRDIGDGVYTIDREGRLTGMNLQAARLLAYRAEDLLGRNMHAAVHHNRADGTPYPLEECALVAARLGGESVHVDDEVFIRADGTALPGRGGPDAARLARLRADAAAAEGQHEDYA